MSTGNTIEAGAKVIGRIRSGSISVGAIVTPTGVVQGMLYAGGNACDIREQSPKIVGEATWAAYGYVVESIPLIGGDISVRVAASGNLIEPQVRSSGLVEAGVVGKANIVERRPSISVNITNTRASQGGVIELGAVSGGVIAAFFDSAGYIEVAPDKVKCRAIQSGVFEVTITEMGPRVKGTIRRHAVKKDPENKDFGGECIEKTACIKGRARTGYALQIRTIERKSKVRSHGITGVVLGVNIMEAGGGVDGSLEQNGDLGRVGSMEEGLPNISGVFVAGRVIEVAVMSGKPEVYGRYKWNQW
jgi:hypothetical protein